MSGRFGRVVTAMATPFKQDGALDVDGVQRLAKHLTENGTDVVLAAGTTGESPTLTTEELEQLWRATVEAVGADRTMAGTGTYSTAESVERTQLAEKCGVGGILLVTPYYNRPTQDGLLAHFKTIAGTTGLPCMLYNVPSRTACTVQVPTLARLAEVDNIVAVKDAVGDPVAAANLRRLAGDAIQVYAGDDKNFLPLLAVGAKGVVSVAAHLVGPSLQALAAAYEAGDNHRALELYLANIELFEGLFAISSPILTKEALNQIGLPGGPMRLPLVDASPSERDFVRDLLDRHDVVRPARASG